MRKKTILAVDDDLDSLDLIRESLDLIDLPVVCATSGPEALNILKDTVPDLIILDLMMPDMNGFALLDIIRANPDMESIPVIIQTAFPTKEHGRRVVGAGLAYMLCKPLDVGVFLAAVRDCLGMPVTAGADGG